MSITQFVNVEFPLSVWYSVAAAYVGWRLRCTAMGMAITKYYAKGAANAH